MNLVSFRNYSLYLLLQLLIPLFSHAQITGKVVRISDGDTFVLLDNQNKQIKVRLHGIDCPEKGQDFYQVAKDYLGSLIFHKNVVVKRINTDRYGRTVGKVWVDTIAVNLELLKAGLAWHYTYYDKSTIYAEAQKSAIKLKKGVWSRKRPTAPWLWRKESSLKLKKV